MKTIHISNEKKRDAQVGFEHKRQKNVMQYKTADDKGYSNARFLKSTIDADPRDLTEWFEDVEAALIAGDPEIDIELMGRKCQVFRKAHKEKVMLQKFVLWKTNKESSGFYPTYVFHYTDYSLGR